MRTFRGRKTSTGEASWRSGSYRPGLGKISATSIRLYVEADRRGRKGKISLSGNPGMRSARNRDRQFLFLYIGVFFTEAVNTSGRVHKALLARIERMAMGADFHVYAFALGGQSFNFKSAGTGDFCIMQFRMKILFHILRPFLSLEQDSGCEPCRPLGQFLNFRAKPAPTTGGVAGEPLSLLRSRIFDKKKVRRKSRMSIPRRGRVWGTEIFFLRLLRRCGVCGGRREQQTGRFGSASV